MHDASDLYKPYERCGLICAFLERCSVQCLIIDNFDHPSFSTTIANLASTLSTLSLTSTSAKLEETTIAGLIRQLRNLTHLTLEGYAGSQHRSGDMTLRDAILSLPVLRNLRLAFCEAVHDHFG